MPRARAGAAPPKTAIERVAGYIRVSTEEQRESGLGLGDQRLRIQGMSAAKGWPEPTIFADEGVSGTKEPKDRPALSHLLAEIRAGNYDAVIVLDLSRLARKTMLVLGLVDEMRRLGVAFVSC
jgi:site-specific DNA recombinase